uniref:Uncharacterized protein n=1 Tax=Brassica oleracea TaxID=3712 RepID=A0A3P6CB58_BRAOL|nr:unnamed protein product [Brassica oleracea]
MCDRVCVGCWSCLPQQLACFYWFAQGTMFWALFVLGLYSCPLPWLEN